MYFDVQEIGEWEVAVPLGALQGVPFSHNVCTGTCIGMCPPQGGRNREQVGLSCMRTWGNRCTLRDNRSLAVIVKISKMISKTNKPRKQHRVPWPKKTMMQVAVSSPSEVVCSKERTYRRRVRQLRRPQP